jgi:hypothetical protein
MALSVPPTFALSRPGTAFATPGFLFTEIQLIDMRTGMTMGLGAQLGADFLRLQSDRCHRLSQSCMDLGAARDLRLMAEEYLNEASKIEITVRNAKF